MATTINLDPWRFLRLIGWRIVKQRRSAFYAILYIAAAILTFSLLSSIGLLYNKIDFQGRMDVVHQHFIRDEMFSTMLTTFSIFILVVSPSFYIQDMEEKGGRLAELTLPASTGERFWSKLIANMLFTLTALAVGFVLDWLVISAIWYFHDGSTVHLIQTMNLSRYVWPILTGYAFFLLGGTLLRRKAWAWTIMAGYLLIQAGISMLKALSKTNYTDIDKLATEANAHHYYLYCAAAALLFLVLARWLFGRLHLVQHKWFNL